MSDDISIPRGGAPIERVTAMPPPASYRGRRTGMDGGTRRLLMVAAALGLVLVAGMGAWTLTGRRTAGVPTIEADSRPLRVKPSDPGGMTAIGANEQVMGDGSETTGDLAPAAERPDPQALRAQRQALVAPQAPVPAPAAAANTATTPPAPAAAAQARSEPAAARPHGSLVQIAAVDSEAAATAEWNRLAKKMPDLLGERKPLVQKAEAGGKALWRVRTGGFADVAEATQFCQKVRAKGGGCALANF